MHLFMGSSVYPPLTDGTVYSVPFDTILHEDMPIVKHFFDESTNHVVKPLEFR